MRVRDAQTARGASCTDPLVLMRDVPSRLFDEFIIQNLFGTLSASSHTMIVT